MKKILIILLTLFISSRVFSQTSPTTQPPANPQQMNTNTVYQDALTKKYYTYNGTVFGWRQLTDSIQVKRIITNSGFGTGTVTSITPGLGFLSHVPITTSGVLNVDSLFFQSIYARLNGGNTLNGNQTINGNVRFPNANQGVAFANGGIANSTDQINFGIAERNGLNIVYFGSTIARFSGPGHGGDIGYIKFESPLSVPNAFNQGDYLPSQYDLAIKLNSNAGADAGKIGTIPLNTFTNGPSFTKYINTPFAQSYSFFDAFGDSITAGTGATTPANAWVSIVGSFLGITPTNHGSAGSQAADQFPIIYPFNPVDSTRQLITYAVGTNDNFIYQTDPDKQANFSGFHLAGVAYLAIPNTKKILGQSGSVATTGTWTNSTYYGGNTGIVSTTNGSTATFSLYGSVLYIAYTIENSNGGTFTLTIDGVSQGTFTATGKNGSSITTQQGTTKGSYLLRIPNLTYSGHTVVMAVTSATSASNKVYLDWASSNAGINLSNSPSVLVSDVPRESGSASFNLDAATQFYSALIRNNVNALASDGLNVSMVDVSGYLNTTTDLNPDHVHPTDAGYLKYSKAELNVINNLLKPQTRQGAKIAQLIAGKINVDETTGNTRFGLSTGANVYLNGNNVQITPGPSGTTSIPSGNLSVTANILGAQIIGQLQTSSVPVSGNLFAGTGRVITSAQTAPLWLWGSASSVHARVVVGGDVSNQMSANTSYSNFIIGSSPIETNTTGTHEWINNATIKPLGTATLDGAAITNTATLEITGASSIGTNNYALYIASGNSAVGGNFGPTSSAFSTASAAIPWGTSYTTNLVGSPGNDLRISSQTSALGIGFYSNTNGSLFAKMFGNGHFIFGATPVDANYWVDIISSGSAGRFRAGNLSVDNSNIPRSITAAVGDNTTQIATDAFVQSAVSSANLASNVPAVLATITGINTKNTGSTALYTVPTGKTLIVTGVYVKCTAATAISAGPMADIGVAAGSVYTNSNNSVTTATQAYVYPTGGTMTPATAGQVVNYTVNTAATGTSQTVSVSIVGFLL